MANDNYVIRERYNGLAEVDGQLIPQRGEVKPEEAHNNGGGVERQRRRRRVTEEG